MQTYPVGRKRPNAWGLYDMHGNVIEWCQDGFAVILPGGSVADPQGPATSNARVFRGGSWNYYGGGCRSANRGWTILGNRSFNLGFRPVLAPGQ
jgi:formylglycine-generating enzyme required for sulfatase activity